MRIAIGIIAGIVLGKKIPERFIKWFAALVFIAFGLIGLYGAFPSRLLMLAAGGAVLLSFGAIFFAGRRKSAQTAAKAAGSSGSV